MIRILLNKIWILLFFSYPCWLHSQSDLDDILSRAGTNSSNLIEIVNSADSIQTERILWLLYNLPDLDLLEIDSSIICDNDYYSNLVRKYQFTDSIFLNYIYYLKIDQEPLSNYKPVIYKYFDPVYPDQDDGQKDFVKFINKWLTDSVSDAPVEFYGPVRSVDQIFRQRTATEREKIILYSAIMKTFGIPCRYVYIPVSTKGLVNFRWIEVYLDENWIPVYLNQPDFTGNFFYPQDTVGVSIVVALNPNGYELITEKYTVASTVNFRLTNGFPHYQDFSVNLLAEGMLRPLDELQTGLDSTGEYSCTLGEGKYFLVLGNRNDQGSTNVKISSFTVHQSQKILIEDVIPPEIPVTGMDTSIYECSLPPQIDTLEGKILIFRGDPNQEASIRAWSQIQHYSSTVKLLTVGGFKPGEILEIEEFNQLVRLQLPLPIVIGIDDHEVVLFHFGYNLNYDDIISKWLY
ncbi:MAG: hypothetical protein APR63_00695 [Desulfuromonas sp. SDB]|nr:MAG: hypothetical protein APR63_00695 [Desulfuromonas sp. SDB]